MARLELYGTSTCPHTHDLREWLEWTRQNYEEYDVEADPGAFLRLRELDSSLCRIPVLVEDGRIVQVGWQGQGCVVELKAG